MVTEFSPPLTRFDVVMGFLRVYLWISVVHVIGAAFSSLGYILSSISSPAVWLQLVAPEGISVLLLLLFPSVISASVLGQTTRDSVTSFPDLRSLIGRCLGVFLFVSSLGQVVLHSGVAMYSWVTKSGSPFFGSSVVASKFFWAGLIGPLLSCLLGFSLAFGPVIRDSFRGR
ncbi:hypothetical protein IAD21_02063 [Abditibacteriota bacterium]|nr:hypothetical protein IAD21_02063 [Abditibacteriota bacterium]